MRRPRTTFPALRPPVALAGTLAALAGLAVLAPLPATATPRDTASTASTAATAATAAGADLRSTTDAVPIVGDCGSGCLNAFEARLGWLVNDARVHADLPLLHVTPGTTDVARRWTWWTATHSRLEHNPWLVSMVDDAGSNGWTQLAENVGASGSADEVFAAYMASPHHRANILSPSVTHMGVGAIPYGGVIWDTVDFVNVYDVHYGPSRVLAATL